MTIEELSGLAPDTKIIVKDGGKELRAVKEKDGGVFVFGKRRRKYGHRYTAELFVRCCPDAYVKDENKEWHKNVKRVIKALENSGLWPDVLAKYRNLEKMTLEDKKDMEKIYWALDYKKKFDWNYVSQSFGDYVSKYPFVFEDQDVNTWYLFEMSDAKLKNMYFGNRNRNSMYKEEIRRAFQEKKAYSTGRIRVNYDVTFGYEPDKNSAWYMEEYRDCGNGHYYIALNENLALFVEDD